MKNITFLHLPMVALLGVTCLGTSVAFAQTTGRAQMADDYATVINSKADLAVTDETRPMDRNSDGNNTVGDVSAFLNSSFDVSADNSNAGVGNPVAEAPARTAAAEDPYFVGKLTGNSLTVSTAGAASFIALQMDINLPATVTEAKLTQAAALEGMTVASNLIEESGDTKIFRVLGYTLTNQEFKFTEATELFTAALKGEVSISDVTMSNVITVDENNIANDIEQTGKIESGAKLGDVNGDGSVNIQDIIAVLDIAKGSNIVYPNSADINNDNEINIQDVISIIILSKQ